MKASVAQLRNLCSQLSERYRRHSDVVGIGVGEKHAGGKRTGWMSVVFFVREKYRSSFPLPGHLILPDAKGDEQPRYVPTDVVEVGDTLRTFSALRTPSLDGGDALVSSVTLNSGTLGVVLRDVDGSQRLWGLTNAHVVAGVDSEETGFRVTSDAFGLAGTIVGTVATYTTLVRNGVNRGDFALIDLDEKLAIKPNLIDKWFAAPVISYYSLSESILGGSRRLFFYASGDDDVRCQTPRLVHESALQLSDGSVLRYGSFHILEVSEDSPCRPTGGHSGSLLATHAFQNDRLFGTGIVIGGSDRFVLAYSWQIVRDWIRKQKASIAA